MICVLNTLLTWNTKSKNTPTPQYTQNADTEPNLYKKKKKLLNTIDSILKKEGICLTERQPRHKMLPNP